MRNMKKFLSLLLVFAMLCGMLMIPAAAAEDETGIENDPAVTSEQSDDVSGEDTEETPDEGTLSGTLGDNLTWKLTPNAASEGETATYTLTISGTGAMSNFEPATTAPWASGTDPYRNYITHVVVEEGVTVIGGKAIHTMKQLTTIDLPSTLEQIKSRGIYNNAALTTINYNGTQAQWDAITSSEDLTGVTINVQPETYAITISQNGSEPMGYWTDPEGAAAAGETVTVYTNAGYDYELGSITVNGSALTNINRGTEMTPTANTFVMPAEDVAIVVTAREIEETSVEVQLKYLNYANNVLSIIVSVNPTNYATAYAYFNVMLDRDNTKILGEPTSMAFSNKTSDTDGSIAFDDNGFVAQVNECFTGDAAEFTLTWKLELEDGDHSIDLVAPTSGIVGKGVSGDGTETTYSSFVEYGHFINWTVENNPTVRVRISADAQLHGAVTLDKTTAKAGDTITVTVKPNEGYEVDTITPLDTVNNIELEVIDGSFEVPTGTTSIMVFVEYKEVADDNLLYGGETIVAGGTYQLAAGATGTITVATTEAVTIIGNGAQWDQDTTSATHGAISSTANQDLSFVGSVAGIDLTLKDMYLNNSGVAAVDVTGTGNTLTFDGTVIIDQNSAPNVHVGPDAGITIKGTTGSRAYLYKTSQTAGIGGNSGEACGAITFGVENGANDFYVFMKGSRQGAVIGSGANCSDVPGNITFHSGIYNLLGVARGAIISGSAGADSQGAGNTIVNGGLINLNVDFSGAAIGGGGYATGNDKSGGLLYVDGGSIRTYIDSNAVSSWTSYGVTEPGVNDAAITAGRVNGEDEDVYLLTVDTTGTSAGSYTIAVDGETYYTGPRYSYSYYKENENRDTDGDGVADLATTPNGTPGNWVVMDEPCFYLYVTGEDHTVTVNGTETTYYWDAENSVFSTTEPEEDDDETGEVPEETFTVGTAVTSPGVKVELPITLTGNIPANTASIEFAGTYYNKQGNGLTFGTCTTEQAGTFTVTPVDPGVGSKPDTLNWTATLTANEDATLTNGELGKLAFQIGTNMNYAADGVQMGVALTGVEFKDAEGNVIETANTYVNGYVEIDWDLAYTITKGIAEHGSITSVMVKNLVDGGDFVESSTYVPVETNAMIKITVEAENGYGYKGMIVTNTKTGETLYEANGMLLFNSTATLQGKYADITITPVFSQLYDITVGETANGTVTVAETAMEGSSVTVTATPASGYKLQAITVTKNSDGSEVEVTNGSFTMPGEAVTVIATFEELVTYKATLNCTDGGSAVLHMTEAEAGVTNRVQKIQANNGYELASIKVNDVELDLANLETSRAAAIGTFIKFTMPAEDVTVTVTFRAPAPAWYGEGTATEYTISTAAELLEFAQIVNGTHGSGVQDDFSGKTVTLTNDIALAEDGLYTAIKDVTYGTSSWPMTTTQYVISAEAPVWTPIGSGTASGNTVSSTANAFAGTFDGQDYTISGVYTGTTNSAAGNTATVQGLFGIVTGTVKNVTVSGCITGNSVVGGVVAYLNGGNVENCVNNAIVFADGGTTPNGNTENGTSRAGATGGIVGLAAGTGSVTECTNNAVVICANTAKGGRVGGIVGLIDQDTDAISISKCVNNGAVEGYQYVAGICGMDYAQNSPIDRCVNTGNITFAAGGKSHAGGIAGQFDCQITNCYNTGNIHSTHTTSQNPRYFGGIAGDYDYTAGHGDIINCYTTGTITYDYSTAADVGIIVGESGYTTNSYFLDTALTNSGSAVAQFQGIAKTDAELKEASMVELLGEAYQASCGYPVLSWQTAKEHNYADGVCTGCGAADPDYVAPHWYGDGTATDYTISTAAELLEFAQIVNGTHASITKDTFLGKTVKLAGNIDLAEVCNETLGTWNAIGGAAENVPLTIDSQEALDAALYQYNILYDNTGWSYKYGTDKNLAYDANKTYYAVVGQIFSGTFDGAGYTIDNLYVLSTTGYAGLFGNVDGTLKNFTVKGSVTTATGTTEVDFVGGVTGKLSEGGKIERVISYVNVDATAKAYNVGGIAGFVGEKNATADNKFSSANNTFVIECINYGSVNGWSQVGGIAGENAGQILRCANYGDVDALKSGSKAGIGGIAGRNGCNNQAYTAGTIMDCYNFGTIADNENKWVGGIAGFNNAASSVINCYNVGTVYGAGQANAIVGQNEASGNCTVSNCWYLESTKVFDESGVYGGNFSNCGPKTEAEMKAAAFAAILGTNFNVDSGNINNGYPVLDWMGGTEAPDIYTVTIPTSGTGYTVAIADGSSTTVVEGGSFSFSVFLLEGYQIDSVMAGETELTAVSGVYTIKNINADVTVTIAVSEKSTAAPTVPVENVVTNSTGTTAATVTGPEGGFVVDGATVNTFNVAADVACTVAVQNADGTYTVLTAVQNAAGGYDFTTTLTEGQTIVVVVKGDLNNDGETSALEARQMLMAATGGYSLNAQQTLAADVDGNGTVSVLEARQVLMGGTSW